MKYNPPQTILNIAQERGSKATTKAAAWRYLLKHLPRHPHRGIITIEQRIHRDADARQRLWDNPRMERRATGRARVLGYPDKSEQWGWYCEAYEINNRLGEREIIRNQYGQIIEHYNLKAKTDYQTYTAYKAAINLIRESAIESWDTIEFDRKGRAEGDACHIELYDFSMSGRAAVVCQRRTEGTRYGVKTVSKTYYLITDDGSVTQTSIQVAKLAKEDLPWGSIVHAAQGNMDVIKNIRKERIEAEKAKESEITTGYKLLKTGDDGTLQSVWDNSSWTIGTPRVEKVKQGHTSGLYYYRDLTQCLDAAHRNEVFGYDRNHRRLVVVEVEATGKQIAYQYGKYAASTITPLRVIASTL